MLYLYLCAFIIETKIIVIKFQNGLRLKNVNFTMSTVANHTLKEETTCLKNDIKSVLMIFFQMMIGILFTMMMLTTTRADVNTGSCKDMLQGYLTGQLSSALGAYQVEALRREFKSFTDVMEKSMKMFKDKIDNDMKAVKG